MVATSFAIQRSADLGQHLSGAIRDMIRRDGLREGERLPTEKELSERFGVSRTVVREALARLRTDGLVVSRQGSGVFVSRASSVFRLPATAKGFAHIRSMYELRLGVEAAAAELAAARREAEDVEALEGNIAGMDDPERRSEADLRFHIGVARATRNPFYESFVGFIGNELAAVIGSAVNNTIERHPGQVRKVITEHRAVLQAIRRGDGPAARAAMSAHLSAALDRLSAALPDTAFS